MVRNLLMMSAFAAASASAAAAQGNAPGLVAPGSPRTGAFDLGVKRYSYSPSAFEQGQAEQLLRWADVGRCVVAKDRRASLSYLSARPGTVEAAVAARRVETVFTSCFWGSQVLGKGVEAYRRAAVADALGVRLSS